MKKSGLYEETDNGFAYHRRAVPPIPGLDQDSRQGNGSVKEEPVGGALDKEKEAEAEAEMELEIMTRVCMMSYILHSHVSLSLSPPPHFLFPSLYYIYLPYSFPSPISPLSHTMSHII